MASISEQLMAPGEWEFTLDYGPNLAAALGLAWDTTTLRMDSAALKAALDFYQHVQVYQGEDLIFTGVLLQRTIGKQGVKIGGLGLEWWLGFGDDGPIITDKEFIAGNNKLSNPAFLLGLLYWRLQENTVWADLGGLVGTTSSPADDDVLQSDENFVADPGMQFAVSSTRERIGGSVGLLRTRLVCEGKFATPDLASLTSLSNSGDWSFNRRVATDVQAAAGGLQFNISRPNKAPADFHSGWTVSQGTVDFYPPGVDGIRFATTGDPGIAGVTAGCPAVPGERYLLTAAVEPFDAGPTGEIYLQADHYQSGSPTGAGRIERSERFGKDLSIIGVKVLSLEITIGQGFDSLQWFIVVENETSAHWVCHWFKAERISPNTGAAEMAQVLGLPAQSLRMIPKRRYRGELTAHVLAGTLQTGEISVKAGYASASAVRNDVWSEVATIRGDNLTMASTLVTFSLDPPSGFDIVWLRFDGRDVFGDTIEITSLRVFDTDDSTRVYEGSPADPFAGISLETEPLTTTSFSVTVPDGTEHIHAEVVAEDQANGWRLHNVSVSRVAPTSHTNAVIDYLLRDPDTGHYLVNPGSIADLGVVPYDLRYRNVNNREVLRQVSRAVVEPQCEWRLNPSNTLDWGSPTSLFSDRTSVFFLSGDLVLIGDPDVAEDVEQRLTRVKVIGADRPAVGNTHRVLTAEQSFVPSETDWNRNPVRRSRLVDDSTVDHISFAANLASYELDRGSTMPVSLDLGLSDWQSVGRFNVGDWIYIYKPEAGLQNLANPQSFRGATIYPTKQRVQKRSWSLGAGEFRVELRKFNGSTVVLPVRWESATTARITVGDELPQFLYDPQGGSMGLQLRRYRASATR